tara:strand:- start:2068 stop:2298 length:231 start_codon:yes stop_codon:yes gene_type:complete
MATPKIVLVDTNKSYDRYYLQFKGGSIGMGGMHKDSISRYGKYSLDVPGLYTKLTDKRFKTKALALKALKMHVRKN